MSLSRFCPACPASEPPPIVFRDVAAEAGIDFRFSNGSRGRHDLVEIMGGGVALIDINNNGFLDLFFCNGGPIVPEPDTVDPPCRLYRNNGDGTFTDITETANAPGPSYAMGAAVGDIDGDGFDDLFVTGWREQRLYRNNGDETFEEITEWAGLTSDRWSTSAAFADLDGDGDLDLYVTNYLAYDPETAPYCAAPDGRRDYCGPEFFSAQADRLYRNDGHGRFTDVSEAAGIALPEGRGLGVLVADVTGNGRIDIYVANDGTACRLFENQGGLRFEEFGLKAGVAFDGAGGVLAGMGVAWGDVDRDGRLDLLVSNFLGRSTIAYQNLGGGRFRDITAPWGLAGSTRDVLGFGLALADFDGDGWLDLIQANGHVLDRERLGEPMAMRPTLLQNIGGRLVDVGPTAGPWFQRAILGRGLAVGDLDNNGRLDVIVNALDAPVAILRNESTEARGLVLDLLGKGPRLAVGAKVRATVGGRILEREVTGGGSYLSASDRRVHIGTTGAERVERVEVTWPSGRVEAWEDLDSSGVIRLNEGRGSH